MPKTHLPNNAEFYERRWFTPGGDVDTTLTLPGLAPFRLHRRQLFRLGTVLLGVEICEDLWAPDPPSTHLALAGALVIANPSGSNELVAKADYRRDLIRQQAARLHCAYVYAGQRPHGVDEGPGVRRPLPGGRERHDARRDRPLPARGSDAAADVDLEKLANERARNITWSTTPIPAGYAVVDVDDELPPLTRLRRFYERDPFVPDDPATVDERAREILAIQSTALARRAMAVGTQRLVIGVSGGLDSTLALLVAVEATKRLGPRPRHGARHHHARAGHDRRSPAPRPTS